MDYGLRAVKHVVPIVARELGFRADGGAEGSSVLEFRRRPSVPVSDGGDGAGEVDFVHGLRDVGCVSPVPEETALFDRHLVQLWILIVV